MSKPTQAQIAAYGKIKVVVDMGLIQLIGIITGADFDEGDFHVDLNDGSMAIPSSHIFPHLHSMHNLDKPVVVEGYNDGEYFIPSEKLLELGIIHPSGLYANDYRLETVMKVCFHQHIATLIDLLNLWQFDYRRWIEAGYAKELED